MSSLKYSGRKHVERPKLTLPELESGVISKALISALNGVLEAPADDLFCCDNGFDFKSNNYATRTCYTFSTAHDDVSIAQNFEPLHY